jgi:cytoskeletal protein CcmA (bactofilin family)
MAIFSKDSNSVSTPRAPLPAGDGSLSIIATGMKITGDIDTEGVVKIEGRVEGAIRAGRQVLVGRQGEVMGDITTREAVIGGTVQGTITASERLEVQGTSSITGDISTRAIAVVEGGTINGFVRILDAALAETDSRASAPDQPSQVAIMQ